MTLVTRVDPGTGTGHPSKFPVETLDDLKRLRWLFADTTFTVDPRKGEGARQAQAEAENNDRVTLAGSGPSPWMDMVQHLAGPIQANYLLADHPEAMAEVLEEMHGHNLRQIKAQLDIVQPDMFWISENTSTTIISPDQFHKFCVGYLSDYARLINEHGVLSVYHMCGHLHELLDDIDAMPHNVHEAFTTPPVGNTTLADGKTHFKKTAIIGGTNAAMWLKDADEIIEEVANDLANCPDRRGIFLTSAGLLPAAVSMEKARRVVEGFKRIPLD